MNMPIPIDVAQAHIADEEITAVNARDLHKFLGVGRRFQTWIKDRIESYGFVEGIDFIVVQRRLPAKKEGQRGGDRRTFEYFCSKNMATKLSQVEKPLSKRQGKGEKKTYIVRSTISGLIKIGKSFTPEQRIRTLSFQSGGNLKALLILDRDIESDLHSRFCSLRVHGEWFDDKQGTIRAYIKNLQQDDLK